MGSDRMGRLGRIRPRSPIVLHPALQPGSAIMNTLLTSRRVVAGMVIFSVFTALGLFNIAQNCMLLNYTNALAGREIWLECIIGRNLGDWYMWALLTPLVVWFA